MSDTVSGGKYVSVKELGASWAQNKTEKMCLIRIRKSLNRINNVISEILAVMKIEAIAMNYDLIQ